MRVSLRHISKQFGSTPVLRGVSLEVADRELFFLLGPSGCGKTTLLRLIAGFYEPDHGELRFGDRSMNGVEPHRRNTGMVFQNYALWPHLSVTENVGYGLDVRAVPAPERRTRILEALRTVRMEPYADRSPNQLSGGQQQRVALARALVIRPDVLLLDEPLSNLDARLRLEMRDEIRRIHDETRITTIYVTHDQKEALSMADRLAVFREGVIEQVGTPRDVYRRPVSRFVAEFIGEANWLPATTRPGAVPMLETPAGPLRLPDTTPPSTSAVSVGFRPEAVRFGDAPINAFDATLEQITYLGEIEQYVLALPDGTRIKAFEQDPATRRDRGQRVRVHLPPEVLFLLPQVSPAPPPPAPERP